jgi:hypothetical protein
VALAFPTPDGVVGIELAALPVERFANHPQSRPAAGRSGAPVARDLKSAIRSESLRAAEAKPAMGVTETIAG